VGRPVVLAINAGSASLKFGLFIAEHPLQPVVRGQYALAGAGTSLRIVQRTAPWERWVPPPDSAPPSLDRAIGHLVDWLRPGLDATGQELVGVGHRIVHGGRRFVGPAQVDASVLADLEALAPLAPLHQPSGLAAVRALAGVWPALPQVASFDTAFHAGQPEAERLYGLPRHVSERGFVRYGFHGLACESVLATLAAESAGLARGRILVAHLGGGASLTGVVGGRSVRNTMGWSALDGLVMTTRCGTLDPALVLALVRDLGSADAVERMLYRESGLAGISGTGGDLRELLDSDGSAARTAIDVYVRRIVLEAGATIAAMGGIDTLVFSGGVGENASLVRSRVCEQLDWIGVAIDPEANAAQATRLEAACSRVAIRRIAVDEEAVIAGAVAARAGGAPPP
jgi:acetate kinase